MGILIPCEYVHLCLLMLFGLMLFQLNRYGSAWIYQAITDANIRFIDINLYSSYVDSFIFSMFLAITGGIITAVSFLALLVSLGEDLVEKAKRTAISIEEIKKTEAKNILTLIAEIIEENKNEKGEKKIVNY